jgi:hypothetical protein
MFNSVDAKIDWASHCDDTAKDVHGLGGTTSARPKGSCKAVECLEKVLGA